MRISVCTFGRLRSQPLLKLIENYQAKFNNSARMLGLGPLVIKEITIKKKCSLIFEAQCLIKSIPKGSYKIALDERGKNLDSLEFANLIALLRDQGTNDLSFIIGSADGLHDKIKNDAEYLLSFGKLVWPHLLMRLLLCEQLYRATSILGSKPYHRT